MKVYVKYANGIFEYELKTPEELSKMTVRELWSYFSKKRAEIYQGGFGFNGEADCEGECFQVAECRISECTDIDDFNTLVEQKFIVRRSYGRMHSSPRFPETDVLETRVYAEQCMPYSDDKKPIVIHDKLYKGFII